MREARRFTIRGRVQGVWFRDSTRRQAEALELSGRAVNLANGDVEVLACGESDALEQFAKWLQTGPPMAKVANVEVQTAEWCDTKGFTIG